MRNQIAISKTAYTTSPIRYTCYKLGNIEVATSLGWSSHKDKNPQVCHHDHRGAYHVLGTTRANAAAMLRAMRAIAQIQAVMDAEKANSNR